MDVKAGEVLIEQGEMGDNLYVVESGEFPVLIGGEQCGRK